MIDMLMTVHSAGLLLVRAVALAIGVLLGRCMEGK